MRVTLEASDILAILGAHFGRELDPAQVDFRLDPLEIEVSGVMPRSAEIETPADRDPAPARATPQRYEVEDRGESMADTLRRAREIELEMRRGR
jgi:hypothetical protein